MLTRRDLFKGALAATAVSLVPISFVDAKPHYESCKAIEDDMIRMESYNAFEETVEMYNKSIYWEYYSAESSFDYSLNWLKMIYKRVDGMFVCLFYHKDVVGYRQYYNKDYTTAVSGVEHQLAYTKKYKKKG